MTGLPRTQRLLFAIFVVLAMALAAPAAAFANAVIDDWRADGRIDGNYSTKQLRAARAQISPEEAEYSDLDEAIDAAIARSMRGGGNDQGGSGRGTTNTPAGQGDATTSDSASTGDQPAGKADADQKRDKQPKVVKDEDPEDLDDEVDSVLENESASDESGEDGSLLAPLVVLGVLLAAGAIVVWRTRANRGPRD